MEIKLSHNALQASCHLWLWNTYPHLRMLFHSNFNNLTSQLPQKEAIILMAKLKHMGLVTGILDYEFYYQGALYVFDFKVGADKLSDQQKEHIRQVEANGGKGYEVRSLEEFQGLIEGIIK